MQKTEVVNPNQDYEKVNKITQMSYSQSKVTSAHPGENGFLKVHASSWIVTSSLYNKKMDVIDQLDQ